MLVVSKLGLKKRDKVRLYGADLHGADLLDIDLTGADFSGADLSDCNLAGACLKKAILARCNLSKADLRAPPSVKRISPKLISQRPI